MEYHEIGEKFEYAGIAFEVMQYRGNQIPCMDCYFRHFRIEDFDCGNTLCRCNERKDGKDVYYKLVEQCKPKENDNMKKQIYYADLTPCDNMDDYKEAAFVP